eukprot:COSAG02_NODE_6987_length_3247_cov_3.009536_5_plen_34_part_00
MIRELKNLLQQILAENQLNPSESERGAHDKCLR